MWESNKAELKIIYRMRFPRKIWRHFCFLLHEKDGKTVLSAYEKDDKTYEEQAYVLRDAVMKEIQDRTEKFKRDSGSAYDDGRQDLNQEAI